MPASWKYFAIRTANILLTVVIVALLLSAFVTTFREEDAMYDINRRVKEEVELMEFDDPEAAYNYREERLQELKEENGFDGSRIGRVFDHAKDMMTFNFGQTVRFTSPRGSPYISDIIMSYLPYTILLFTTAAAIYSVLAIFIGLKIAQKAGSKLDKFITLLGASLSSVPLWWAAMIFVLIFSYILGWYPTPVPSYPTVQTLGYRGYFKEILIKMSLPLFTIVVVRFGATTWISRNIVTRVLEDDYIMNARAKGVPESKVLYGHTLKTAGPPIATTVILALLTSLGGALIAEIIFQWPGIGFLLRIAISDRTQYIGARGIEEQLIAAITFVLSVISIIGLYITDIIYGLLDPRVEVGYQSREEVK